MLDLYENLGAIADALPVAMRGDVLVIMRRPAWKLPDTPAHRTVRARIRRALPDYVAPLLPVTIDMVRQPGGWDVLVRWATDAGHVRSSSS